MEGYYGLVKALSLSNTSFLMDITDYVQVYSIFGFDTTASGNGVDCEQISVPVDGGGVDYSVSMVFDYPMPENVQLFVLAELESLMIIDNSGQAKIAPYPLFYQCIKMSLLERSLISRAQLQIECQGLVSVIGPSHSVSGIFCVIMSRCISTILCSFCFSRERRS